MSVDGSMSDPARLIGTWGLVAYTLELSDGRVIRPLGSEPAGQLVYTVGGRMAAHLMHGGTPDPDAPAPPDPVVGAGYCGAYGVEGNRVYHDVEIATVPGRPGTTLMREWSFDDEDLVLIARDGPRVPPPSKGILRWRRIEEV